LIASRTFCSAGDSARSEAAATSAHKIANRNIDIGYYDKVERGLAQG
jgi:hypothetical protein